MKKKLVVLSLAFFLLIVVSLFQQVDDLLFRFRLLEEAAEILISKMSRDVFETAQVIAGAIRGGHKQKQNMDRLTVEAGEIHTATRQRHRRDKMIDRRMLGVRNGDAVADTG